MGELRKRLTQLTARYIGALLLGIAMKLSSESGLTPEDERTIHQLAAEFAAWIGALAGFGIDLFIHRLSATGILRPAGSATAPTRAGN